MTATSGGTPRSLAGLFELAEAGQLGSGDDRTMVSLGFVTQQGVRHADRDSFYRNQVLSLRVADAVGSCAMEPGTASDDLIFDCIGQQVSALFRHPESAVRVAALDAYLQCLYPHHEHGEEVRIKRGDSLRKSLGRARSVVELLPAVRRQRVLVIGVVNSLLREISTRGGSYVACDYKGGETEWGEPIITDATQRIDECDAILASGMVVGNDTFGYLLEHARRTNKPFVLFAQTASAILPWFQPSGVTAVSAEPYPFFWLDGAASSIYRYWSSAPAEPPEYREEVS